MKTLLLAAASLALLSAGAGAATADEAGNCATVQAVVADTNNGAPYMVDAVTRSEIATSDCGVRTATFAWTILADTTELNDNWQAVLSGNFNAGFCARAELAAAVNAGWAVIASWTTQDGQVYSTQVACS